MLKLQGMLEMLVVRRRRRRQRSHLRVEEVVVERRHQREVQEVRVRFLCLCLWPCLYPSHRVGVGEQFHWQEVVAVVRLHQLVLLQQQRPLGVVAEVVVRSRLQEGLVAVVAVVVRFH